MRSMLLEAPKTPLWLRDVPQPCASAGQVLLRVHCCGVCRTDLHVVDGELPSPRFPLAPGHQIVGTVVEVGPSVSDLAVGQRVGVPWLGWTDGTCEFCRTGRENLCEQALFTGYQFLETFMYTLPDYALTKAKGGSP
jgi:propanol-preferring alcohol dehydrogenase